MEFEKDKNVNTPRERMIGKWVCLKKKLRQMENFSFNYTDILEKLLLNEEKHKYAQLKVLTLKKII